MTLRYHEGLNASVSIMMGQPIVAGCTVSFSQTLHVLHYALAKFNKTVAFEEFHLRLVHQRQQVSVRRTAIRCSLQVRMMNDLRRDIQTMPLSTIHHI